MLDDGQFVEIFYACCKKERLHKFGYLKAGAEGFFCPLCGERVNYDPTEFVWLMNKETTDADLKITLYPIE